MRQCENVIVKYLERSLKKATVLTNKGSGPITPSDHNSTSLILESSFWPYLLFSYDEAHTVAASASAMPLACELPSSTQTHLRSVPFVDMIPEQQRDIKIGMIGTSICVIKDSWHFSC